MRSFLALAVVFVTFIGSCSSKFNIDDGNLYSIKFNSLEKSLTAKSTEDESLLNNPPDLLQTVTMTTAHNEKYVCELPSEESEEKNAKDEYDVSVRNVLPKFDLNYFFYFLIRGHRFLKFLKKFSFNPSVPTGLNTIGLMSYATDGELLPSVPTSYEQESRKYSKNVRKVENIRQSFSTF